MNLRQKAGNRLIVGARRVFAGTPIQEYKITAYIYKQLSQYMYKGDEVKTQFRGLKLLLPLKDKAIVPSILGGYFEKVELSIFEDLLPSIKTFFDVGANIGIYSLLASKSNRKSVSYSFEPVPENISYFKKNIKLNGAQNIHVVSKAVGSRKNKLRLVLANDSIATHSTSKKHVKKPAGAITVDEITLDEFSAEAGLKVDIMKVDVEGYEPKVVEGSVETIAKYKPTIFIEFDPDAIKLSGGDPGSMIDNLDSIYGPGIYLINEVKPRISRITPRKLKNIKVYGNSNLIFTDNPRHRKIIESSEFYK